MSSPGKREKTNIAGRAEKLVRHFGKNKNFVQELLRENERLRYKVLHREQELEEAGRGEAGASEDMLVEVRRLKENQEALQAKFEQLKKENEDFRRRSDDLEKQNENFLNLFVSSYHLHSTLNEESILMTITEILLNLVGAEAFGLWLVNQETGELELVTFTDGSGYLGGAVPALSGDLVGKMAGGQSYYAPDRTMGEDDGQPMACIPLSVEEQPVGVVAIYKLLVQKEGFTGLDHELLDLLASQAATGLTGARLFRRAGGDLKRLVSPNGQEG
jgi:hypothetical protein